MQNPERSFAYESWANRRVYEHLCSLENPPARACELLAHVLAGLAVWMARIQGQDSTGIAIWSACSLSDCETHLNAVDSAQSAVLRSLQDTPLDNEVRYSNQHGLSYVTSIRDIVFHLASHGAYHRGQISVTLRHCNLEPVNTDYITFVRDLAGQPLEALKLRTWTASILLWGPAEFLDQTRMT